MFYDILVQLPRSPSKKISTPILPIDETVARFAPVLQAKLIPQVRPIFVKAGHLTEVRLEPGMESLSVLSRNTTYDISGVQLTH
jgi:hypothetical protein